MKWPWTKQKEDEASIIWSSGFTSGWNKAWECMWPLQAEGLTKMKQRIEEQAIQSVLDRKHGNNKTDN